MSRRFEEIAWRDTPMGPISLRRRLEPSLGVDVYEVKLGDEFLMSSLFTVAEVELARLALAAVSGENIDVAVGGLGLGFTARAVLEDPRVRSATVVEALEEVIAWHHRGLVPGAEQLTADPRCRLVHGDFFALVAEGTLGSGSSRTRFDAILVDIDHSPRHVLQPHHAELYDEEGLQAVAELLRPGGCFALWSDDPPDDPFVAALADAFDGCSAQVITFRNHYTGGESSNTVYVANRR